MCHTQLYALLLEVYPAHSPTPFTMEYAQSARSPVEQHAHMIPHHGTDVFHGTTGRPAPLKSVTTG
jgi:hypothetical protein